VPEKPKIVVTNRIFPETRQLLDRYAHVVQNEAEDPWSQAEVTERCRDAFGVLTFMTDLIDRRFIEACPDLKIVGAALKGFDNIDVDACTDAGVWASIVPDLLTVPTAELAVGLMLSLGRSIAAADSQIRSSGFSGWRPTFYGAGLAGSTVGIFGFGCVGRAIAERLAGFQCRVLAWDAAVARPSGSLDGHVAMASRDQLLEESDFLVLALPLNAETLHMFGRDTIARVKRGARIVNPARGSLVDEAAIADAIEAGHLAGYAADVFECEDWAREPRPGEIEPRLRGAGAPTVLTPHIGSAVTRVRQEIERSAAESIIDVISGRVPRYAVNNLTGAPDAQSFARQNLSQGS
jgi:phosphonate dehydrogenase